MLFVRLLAICCLITGALTLFKMRNTSINIDSVLYLAQLRACHVQCTYYYYYVFEMITVDMFFE